LYDKFAECEIKKRWGQNNKASNYAKNHDN